MPTLTVQHVCYNPPYPAMRISRPVNAYGGFTLLKETKSAIEANHQFTFDTALVSQTLIIGTHKHYLSFVNITGLAGGPVTWIDHGAAPNPTMTGTADVMARIVYSPEFVPGGSGNGAFIDAFDISTGNLVDNYFVSVSSDKQDEIQKGNVYGFVPGMEQIDKFPPPEGYDHLTVTAYPHITHDADTPDTVNANFVEWVNLNASVRATRQGLSSFVSPTDHISVMLAFYKSIVLRPL